MTNQTPEQRARDLIDKQLTASGWIVQSKDKINLGAGVGVAVREYQTDIWSCRLHTVCKQETGRCY